MTTLQIEAIRLRDLIRKHANDCMQAGVSPRHLAKVLDAETEMGESLAFFAPSSPTPNPNGDVRPVFPRGRWSNNRGEAA